MRRSHSQDPAPEGEDAASHQGRPHPHPLRRLQGQGVDGAVPSEYRTEDRRQAEGVQRAELHAGLCRQEGEIRRGGETRWSQYLHRQEGPVINFR